MSQKGESRARIIAYIFAVLIPVLLTVQVFQA